MEKDIILESVMGILFPPDITRCFKITRVIEKEGYIQIKLEERIELKPKSDRELVSDGFMNKLELQSFPLKGKAVYLMIYRRRWKEKGGTENYFNQYDLNPEGVKATKEFAAFLKDTFGQTPEQYNDNRDMLMR